MATLEACMNNNGGRKRKQRIFEFKSFGNSIIDLTGPFRDNIRSFLNEYGERIEEQLTDAIDNKVWSILLLCEANGAVFPLYTIEELVDDQSRSPFCSHCKFARWGHHFLCKRRYRFIIPAYGDKRPLKDHYQKNSLELDDSHILHGLIHCNGFGHLISINKLELGSSNSLTESDVMNLWDSICISLKTRKVTVADVKLDRSMELRLIHGVAYEISWFGKWGYKFWHGCFGITEDQYDRALKFLAKLELDKIINDFKTTRKGRKIRQIVCKYRELSEIPLNSLSDLLRFLLEFKPTGTIRRDNVLSSRKVPKLELDTLYLESQSSMSLDEFMTSLMDSDCRWPQRRVEYSIDIIVKLLQNKNKPMSRHELREKAREFIGDTGLIDYVLKSINVLTIGNFIVRRIVNTLTKLVEFEIEEVTDDSRTTKMLSSLWKFEPRWPKQRIEKTAKVIANALRENKILNNGKNGAMSRKDLRHMASMYIGDTGLIDFVLKSIHNSVIGNQIVTRTKNPLTRLIEFEIRDGKNEEFGIDQEEEEEDQEMGVDGHLLYLYNNVLLGYPSRDLVSRASRIILNSKYFSKEWEFGEGNDEFMVLKCRVLPSFSELETELTRRLPPGEFIKVPRWMTVGEVKEVAQCALRDTYCVMDQFVVTQIGGLKKKPDGLALSCAVVDGVEVWLRGSGLDLGTALRYEDGGGRASEWRVDCSCGARDQDGERMIGCDECHVWRHTRCSSIEDDEAAPLEFICPECYAKSKSELLSQ